MIKRFSQWVMTNRYLLCVLSFFFSRETWANTLVQADMIELWSPYTFMLGLSLPFIVIPLFFRSNIKQHDFFPLVILLAFLSAYAVYDSLWGQSTTLFLTVVCLSVTLSLWFSFFSLTLPKKITLWFRYFIIFTGCCAALLHVFLPTEYEHIISLTFLVLMAIYQGYLCGNFHSTNKFLMKLAYASIPLCFLLNVTLFFWGYSEKSIWEASVAVSVLSIILLCGSIIFFFEKIKSALHAGGKNQSVNSIEHMQDPITDLPTTKHVIDCFQQCIVNEGNKKYAAVVFKPVNFPQVNSVLGHHNSDLLLLQFAYSVKSALQEHNALISFSAESPVHIARLQGLHFVAILDVASSEHDDRLLIKQLCDLLSQSVPKAMSFKSYSLNFELAIGIAIQGEHGKNAVELIANAEDALLFGEKNQLKLNYFDSQLHVFSQQQLVQMEQFKTDIVAENLHFYMQPQVNMKKKEIKGFNALVHWYNNSETPISLDDFVELAELSGDIYSFTIQHLSYAITMLESLKTLSANSQVSVRLASHHNLDDGTVEFIEKQLERYDIQPSQLVIEIPELLILEHKAKTKAFIDQLNALSISITIADFSGSFDVLKYLRKLQVNQVKINCKLLSDAPSNAIEKAIVNALLNLCRTMDLIVVGTHIDTNETAKSFVSIGGSIAEGGVISNGIATDELPIWIQRWSTMYAQDKPK